MESCFGGHLLILGGYSYRKKSMSSEKSYWFCCNAKCLAKGILRSGGEFRMTHSEHNHEPDFEKIKRKKKLAELKKLALQSSIPGQDLLEALNITDDVKKYLGFIRTCRRRNSKRHRQVMSKQIPLCVGTNYKRLPSRISSREMLFHSGYFFRQDSINPQNEKCKYWRCKVKNCKARAKTDDSGNLTVLKPFHNHPAEASEETFKNLKQMVKSETPTSDKPTFSATVREQEVRKSLEKSDRRVRHELERQNREKSTSSKESASTIEDPNSGFYPSSTDPETFSLEKLMAETLAEDYCVTHEFSESVNLLKSEENPH